MAGTTDTHTRTINDAHGGAHIYEISPMPAGEGFALMADLGVLVGGTVGRGLGVLLDGAGDDVSAIDNIDVSPDVLGDALEAFFARLNEFGSVILAHRLLKYVMRDGCGFETGSYRFDDVYRANYGELRQALAAVLEVNYGSFFGGLAVVMNRLTPTH